MSNLIFRSLTPNDLPQMYAAFIEAFSQYSVNMKTSKETFEQRMIGKLNINYELSPAAFDGEKLIGFIFHTINIYEGKSTAYNGGTGVLPDYWGQNITLKLHEYIIPDLQKNGVKRCLLEVIMTNEQAIKAYTRVGFSRTKLYKCFKLTEELPKHKASNKVSFHITKNLNMEAYNAFATSKPSMLDSSQQLVFNVENETVLEAKIDAELVGYSVFQHKQGRISQLAVSERYKHQGIGTALILETQNLSVVKALTVINVEEKEESIITFLDSIGFENQVNQFEMELIL